MQKAEGRNLAEKEWLAEYAKAYPHRCKCLSDRSFQLIRKAFLKIIPQHEDSPPPSAVVLEAIAVGHRVSSRALAEYRADARKRVRNLQ